MSSFDFSAISAQLEEISDECQKSVDVEMSSVFDEKHTGGFDHGQNIDCATPSKGPKHVLRLFSPRYMPYSPRKGMHTSRRQLFQQLICVDRKRENMDLNDDSACLLDKNECGMPMESNSIDGSGFSENLIEPMIIEDTIVREESNSPVEHSSNLSPTILVDESTQNENSPKELHVFLTPKKAEPVAVTDNHDHSDQTEDELNENAEAYYRSESEYEYDSDGAPVRVYLNEDVQ